MVEVEYIGGLGNNLFQYCLGRIIASRKRLMFRAPPLNGFRHADQEAAGDIVSEPEVKLTGHKISLENILAPDYRGKIILRGFFQNYGYYKEYADEIRSWLSLQPWPEDHAEDLLVMVRLGDFKAAGLRLDLSYYRTVLRALDRRRLFITSDEPGHGIIRELIADTGATLIKTDALDTIRFAASCGKLLLSNSTFGWWCGFLSRAAQIHLPLPNTGALGSWGIGRFKDGLDLRVDEPRYIYHYNAPIGGECDSSVGPLEIKRIMSEEYLPAHRDSTAFWWNY